MPDVTASYMEYPLILLRRQRLILPYLIACYERIAYK